MKQVPWRQCPTLAEQAQAQAMLSLIYKSIECNCLSLLIFFIIIASNGLSFIRNGLVSLVSSMTYVYFFFKFNRY